MLMRGARRGTNCLRTYIAVHNDLIQGLPAEGSFTISESEPQVSVSLSPYLPFTFKFLSLINLKNIKIFKRCLWEKLKIFLSSALTLSSLYQILDCFLWHLLSFFFFFNLCILMTYWKKSIPVYHSGLLSVVLRIEFGTLKPQAWRSVAWQFQNGMLIQLFLIQFRQS